MKYFILILISTFYLSKENNSLNIQNLLPVPDMLNYIVDSGKNIELPAKIKKTLFEELDILRNKFLKELDYKNVTNTFTTTTSNYYRSYSTQKSIKLDKHIKTVRPTWDEVLFFYGGIANISGQKINGKQISKSDLDDGLFDLQVKISEIALKDVDDCEVTFTFKGDRRQLNFHGVESTEKRRAFYDINERTDYNQMNIFELIKKAQNISNNKDIPIITFEIPGNRFFDDIEHELLITDILYRDLISKMNDFLVDAQFVVENIIDNDTFNNIPFISNIIIENNIRYDQNLQIIGKTNDIIALRNLIYEVKDESLIEIIKEKISNDLIVMYNKHENYYENSRSMFDITIPFPLLSITYTKYNIGYKSSTNSYSYYDRPSVNARIYQKIINSPESVNIEDIKNISGFQRTTSLNMFMGISTKNFYEPVKRGQWNNYWHWGTVAVYWPYIGIGSEYIFENGRFFGFNTFYIVPSITFGTYF
tara:strand:- start:217 stop:1650 length:1434 start_codon:yes stop_codon:yes gene_type:complete